MIATPLLSTRRLRLRPLTTDDAGALSALLGDDHAAIQMTSHIPDPCTVEGARDWIRMRSRPNSHPFAIESNGVFVGVIGCHLQGEVASLGYSLGRAYWGQGFATEAAEEVLRFIVSIGLRRAEADTFVDNPASVRVLEKVGFTYIDTVDEEQPVRGGVRQIHRFAWTAAR